MLQVHRTPHAAGAQDVKVDTLQVCAQRACSCSTAEGVWVHKLL